MSVMRTRRKAEKKPMIFGARIIGRCVGMWSLARCLLWNGMVNCEVESSFMDLRWCDVMTLRRVPLARDFLQPIIDLNQRYM